MLRFDNVKHVSILRNDASLRGDADVSMPNMLNVTGGSVWRQKKKQRVDEGKTGQDLRYCSKN